MHDFQGSWAVASGQPTPQMTCARSRNRQGIDSVEMTSLLYLYLHHHTSMLPTQIKRLLHSLFSSSSITHHCSTSKSAELTYISLILKYQNDDCITIRVPHIHEIRRCPLISTAPSNSSETKSINSIIGSLPPTTLFL